LHCGTHHPRSGGPAHPPAVTPPRKVVESFARDIDSPAIAEEVIRRLGLRMTPDELLRNPTVEPEPESAFSIRISYRDPARETPQRARRSCSRSVALCSLNSDMSANEADSPSISHSISVCVGEQQNEYRAVFFNALWCSAR
jgi:capsular polysaccharide biosynthesis protein